MVRDSSGGVERKGPPGGASLGSIGAGENHTANSLLVELQEGTVLFSRNFVASLKLRELVWPGRFLIPQTCSASQWKWKWRRGMCTAPVRCLVAFAPGT